MLLQGKPRSAAVNSDTYRILQLVDNGTFMYAKHGNLVDADASGTKASSKHIEARLLFIIYRSFSIRKRKCLGHVLHHDVLLRDILEGRMLGKCTRRRKKLQLMSNICEGTS